MVRNGLENKNGKLVEEIEWTHSPLLVTTCLHLKSCWCLVDGCLIDLEGQEAWLKVHELANNGSWQEPPSDFAALAACCCSEVPQEQFRCGHGFDEEPTQSVPPDVSSVTVEFPGTTRSFLVSIKCFRASKQHAYRGWFFPANLIAVFLPCSYVGEGLLRGIWIVVSQEGKWLFIRPSVSDKKIGNVPMFKT